MSSTLVDSIRETLGDKCTAELRRIYDVGDLSVWSPEAFEAIRDILSDRGEADLMPVPSARPAKELEHTRHPKPASVTIPAGILHRSLSVMIDGAILWPFAASAYYLGFHFKAIPLYFCMIVLFLLYQPFMESRFGGTIGKLAMGLRFMDQQGRQLSLARAFCRYSLYLIERLVGIGILVVYLRMPEFQSGALDPESVLSRGVPAVVQVLFGLLFLFDWSAVLFTEYRQTLHDLLAGAYCVEEVEAEQSGDGFGARRFF